MWIDTPGFFDTKRSEDEMRTEIIKCVTECAPGPHVFLVVLKVEKYTEHEQAVIEKILQFFSEEALKYTIVLFTHGDQLSEGEKIKEFVEQCEGLTDLVKKCGGRCHVFDNKYWKKKEEDEYRYNQFQVTKLLKTIDEMVEVNKGSCYTSEMLQKVRQDTLQEEANITVFAKQVVKYTVVATGALLGAFLGGAMKLMSEGGSSVPLVAGVAGVALGTAAGVAAGLDITGAAPAKDPTSS